MAVLPAVVSPAVQLAVVDVAGGRERLPARGTPQALLVPARAVHPQQETVADDAAAALTHGPRGSAAACRHPGGGMGQDGTEGGHKETHFTR